MPLEVILFRKLLLIVVLLTLFEFSGAIFLKINKPNAAMRDGDAALQVFFISIFKLTTIKYSSSEHTHTKKSSLNRLHVFDFEEWLAH